MSKFLVPSTTRLRVFHKSSILAQCSYQLRNASNYMPRSKYAKVTRLDKFHRTQKAALRQEKLNAIQRADAISANFPVSEITPTLSKSTSGQTQIAQFPFTVVRTPSSQLPVYESAKNGGNRHITVIRKISGDLNTLATQLRDVLKMPEFIVDQKGNKKANVAINRLTNQVILRGWRGKEVKAWMEGVGF